MSIGIIIIGDEILSGRRQDKHLAKVIELLGARGLALDWAEYVGDDPARITATLARASASGDIVFCTGGIGATPDDHTRQCAAAALGVPLALHPEAKALISERIRETHTDPATPVDFDSPENRHRFNMGVFPMGATIIPNGYNRIPGFSVGELHFVPGFPVMAWPMIEWVLDTKYQHLHHVTPHAERSVVQQRTAALPTPWPRPRPWRLRASSTRQASWIRLVPWTPSQRLAQQPRPRAPPARRAPARS